MGSATVRRDGDILGSYQLIELLGRGGMGDVYTGRHRLLGRLAAIKVLRARFAKDRTATERFFREARIVANLDHPAVVEIYDFGYAEDGAAYIAMELLRGEDLRARLRRERKLSSEVAIRFARQLLLVLEVAHDAGVIHRDLKPENVFISDNPLVPGGQEIKLLDFGIAKLADGQAVPSITQTGQIIGTPTYMAPEQCRASGRYDARTDLYALGCILFEMITGSPPFLKTGGTQQIFLAHLGTPAPRLRGEGDELDAIVARLLQKDPEDRFDSAAAVLRVLDQLGDPAATQVALAPDMTGRNLLEAPTIAPAGRPAERDQAPTANLGPKARRDSDRSEESGESRAETRPAGPAMPAVAETRFPSMRSGHVRWLAGGALVLALCGVVALIAVFGGGEDKEPVAGTPEVEADGGAAPAKAAAAAAISFDAAPPPEAADAGPTPPARRRRAAQRQTPTRPHHETKPKERKTAAQPADDDTLSVNPF